MFLISPLLYWQDVQDEMVSLDNDAYLNSLEFMVFTNTWGDGKRNTRFWQDRTEEDSV